MLYQSQPENFKIGFNGVGCFIESSGKILLLHRLDHKREGNTWGIPGGKIDPGEEILNAIIREIKEETGLEIPSKNLEYLKKVFVKFPDYDFIYHMYKTFIPSRPEIKINTEEHKNFIWLTPQKTLTRTTITLMPDLDECVKLIYGI